MVKLNLDYKERKLKADSVKIVSTQSIIHQNSGSLTILGFGNDGNMYSWSYLQGGWHLHAEDTIEYKNALIDLEKERKKLLKTGKKNV